MFCALVTIVFLVFVIIFGVTISIIDINKYNFGLHFCLLAIIGIMVSFSVCILKPSSIPNPRWYEKWCATLHEKFQRKDEDTQEGMEADDATAEDLRLVKSYPAF